MKQTHIFVPGFSVVAMVVAILLGGCEKPIDPNDGEGEGDDGNVTLHFTPYRQEGFTRTATALTNQCSRLSVAIFTADGVKKKNVAQDNEHDGFGTVNVTLAAGTYKIVAIAHNGLGNATISSTEKVTFSNNKVTDTFAYYGTLTVGEDPLEETLEMTRRVAMVRLTLPEGGVPNGVSRIKFYYTGGSSTYNPSTGYGCVNSKQTEYRDCRDENAQPVNVYELYTLPHGETGAIKKLTVTALSEDDDEIFEEELLNVPLERNKITTWTGALFGGGGTIGTGGIFLTLDTSWDGILNYGF